MRNIVIIFLLCIGFSCVSAQEVYNSSGKPGYHKKTKKNKGYDPSKLIIGGGLDAGYSGGYAIAGIAPIVGYKFTGHLAAGVGLGYLYVQQPYIQIYTTYYYVKDNIVYPNLWARYFIWRGLYLSGSFEYDITWQSQPDDNYPQITHKEMLNAESLLGGLGIKQPLGGRASFFIEAVHDFLQQPNSPYYGQPIIFHGGIAVGL